MNEKVVCDKCGDDDQSKEHRDLAGYTLCIECYKKYSGIKDKSCACNGR